MAADASPDLLRLITCGSVDDGKSTLIGRLMADTGAVPEDVLEQLARDSQRFGTQGTALDYALLLDGLEAEREQGITIDVAYRYFATPARAFIVADCPGHEQYTRNMATGASTADLAVVLVDAGKGLLRQTRRHSYICALMGIREVILAVNKMDRVDYAEARFDAIARDYATLAARLGITRVTAIPLAAVHGDNLVQRSARMPWYRGPSLLEALHAAQPRVEAAAPLCLPVQWVNRPHAEFRGYCGTLAAGRIGVGDTVSVWPAGLRATVARVLDAGRDVAQAGAGAAVTVTLAEDCDIARGDVIAAAGAPPEIADQFACHLLWMGEAPLLPGRPYALRLGSASALAQVTEIRHKIDVDTQEAVPARTLQLNEVGYCQLSVDHALAFAPYAHNRALGGFVLIDRISNASVGAGMIDFALRRASNIHWQHVDVNRAARAAQNGQQPRCLWFTGLSGSGKSTLANAVEKRLFALGHRTYLLDGDNVRHGLNRDLGFTAEDRVENIRRVAEVARLMVDAGLIVLVAFISPFRAERRMARERFGADEFVEVFVDAPLAVCEARDVKGLYAKARAGQLRNFTGVDSPYEPPQAPELHLLSAEGALDVMVEQVVRRALDG
ncbi:MAG: adenylyl-sulfate kinase [Metallibacterium scheffleri]|jgi:bifunctional enzyme CysN/CysC|uniref:adenylyl-sulfate kinase n=1 Tax=Metallibacterium scheffleri TaxID=993689 RepID=UPI0026EC727E|nr:adenylyl-sulfate kinase [Metallibacterium scheffleri]MCK9367522.1 adenylyl-sulfate kinase [Metallibacterium scheffleri]